MPQIRFSSSASKYLKKIKDKMLLSRYKEAIDKILEDHTIGEPKTGDLRGIFGYDVHYNGKNYEIAYMVEYVQDKIIVVVMAGSRENFYKELKS